MYKQDPNDSNKQVPGALPDNFFQRESYPAICTLTKSPNYVLITTALNDEFGFFYERLRRGGQLRQTIS